MAVCVLVCAYMHVYVRKFMHMYMYTHSDHIPYYCQVCCAVPPRKGTGLHMLLCITPVSSTGLIGGADIEVEFSWLARVIQERDLVFARMLVKYYSTIGSILLQVINHSERQERGAGVGGEDCDWKLPETQHKVSYLPDFQASNTAGALGCGLLNPALEDFLKFPFLQHSLTGFILGIFPVSSSLHSHLPYTQSGTLRLVEWKTLSSIH